MSMAGSMKECTVGNLTLMSVSVFDRVSFVEEIEVGGKAYQKNIMTHERRVPGSGSGCGCGCPKFQASAVDAG